MKQLWNISDTSLKGILTACAPVPLIFLYLEVNTPPRVLEISIAAASIISCLLYSLYRFPNNRINKFFGILGVTTGYVSTFNFIGKDPSLALLASITVVSFIFHIIDIDLKIFYSKPREDIAAQKAKRGALSVPVIVLVSQLTNLVDTPFFIYAVSISTILVLILYIYWIKVGKSWYFLTLPIISFLILGISFALNKTAYISSTSSLICLCCYISITHRKSMKVLKRDRWWDVLIDHPARILITTFLLLSIIGTLLLLLPSSTYKEGISLIDAVFTSVSAVCVTGLIVLDTPKDFTFFGQFNILLLIQLGGLGIMSITTVALHTMGHRLSLKQERLLTSMTDTKQDELITSLKTILLFTFIAEFAGAFLLTISFYSSGCQFPEALWKGIFTAISAYCNAGFSLQSDSLIPFQNNGFILHIVSLLIIFGGIAPATSLIIPRWISGKTIPIPARIALVTTVILLISGTLFMLMFEWNGALAELSFMDKIHNAWFQSVTLRTAGFNSIDFTVLSNPTFIVMIFYMLIGGSPGGTAGGLKTTTIGVLAMTFWANITNRDEIIIQNRRINSGSIFRAVTIVVSGAVIWIIVVLMLEVTQQIPQTDLIFEATSAIGTVGLSTGATALLDEIGKIIIVIAMFAGRIGPMTLFMLLNRDQALSGSRCPETKIPLS